MTAIERAGSGLRQFVGDVATGFFEITHNSFALLGLAVMFGVLTLATKPELRQAGEEQLRAWLQMRQSAETGMVEDLSAIERTTAKAPEGLPKHQVALIQWLSKKYSVAPEPLAALVVEAYESGKRARIEPTLILAVMAIESGFNPFAQSAMGAQGLMQVMTKVHGEKFAGFGGKLAAFDPVSNLRVGVRVLQECIARAGSVEAGLMAYVGATNADADNGYTAKVLAEYARLQMVAAGRQISHTLALPSVPPTATPLRPPVSEVS